MPTYRYEHEGAGCLLGQAFDVVQPMREAAMETCPECGEPIYRVVGRTFVSTPTGDTDLRDKGFAKLVRRDNGVYENVTALKGESKVWEADKPETMPDVKRRVSD